MIVKNNIELQTHRMIYTQNKIYNKGLRDIQLLNPCIMSMMQRKRQSPDFDKSA